MREAAETVRARNTRVGTNNTVHDRNRDRGRAVRRRGCRTRSTRRTRDHNIRRTGHRRRVVPVAVAAPHFVPIDQLFDVEDWILIFAFIERFGGRAFHFPHDRQGGVLLDHSRVEKASGLDGEKTSLGLRLSVRRREAALSRDLQNFNFGSLVEAPSLQGHSVTITVRPTY